MGERRAAAIVPMAPHHLDVVVAIESATQPRPWSRAMFAEEFGRDDRHYLVALDAVDVVVGFAGVAMFAGEAHVMTVHVIDAVRGRGIGTRLVAGLLAHARDIGCQAATLEVGAANGPAQRLYGRLGFVERGRRLGYYPNGDDAVIMWLDDLPGVGDPAGVDDRPAASRPTATTGG